MKRGFAFGVAVGLIVSAIVGAIFVALNGLASSAWFVLSPGLLSHAAASDMLERPPWYETWPPFVLINVVWYSLVGLVVAAATKVFAWFKVSEGQ
jgi:hypothetical protein